MQNYNDLLKEIEINLDLNNKILLSEKQDIAFEEFKKGNSIFITSSAGCGKSFLLKQFLDFHANSDKKMYLTSTTGVSAYNINGMTIHSFLGIGTGEEEVSVLLNRILKNKPTKKRIQFTDILVIDEISMMSASLFEKINFILQDIKNNGAFFGGIQVVLTGDLLQLLPVFKENLYDEHSELDSRLITSCKLFKTNFSISNKTIIILEKNFRQDESETEFIELLNRTRIGKISNSDIKLLNSKCLEYNKNENKDSIHLVSSNKKANLINTQKMKLLHSQEIEFTATFTQKGTNKATLNLLEKELKSQFTQKGLLITCFKKGCRVMLIKNLDTDIGLINGSVGTILEIEGRPIVLFDNGIKRNMISEDFELKLNENSVTGHQIPLIMAFAITIHKSQSLTLNTAVLDLADCFTYHMVYVALSRVISLKNINLKSFNHKKIKVHPEMLSFYE